MIGLPENVPIYLCTEPVDFRKGFDGLTGVVTSQLGQNVACGSLFLFV
ncbi:IS66 family insertion sequence element accessory protein TnpB, partial [Roseimaritima sediminicola]